MDVQDLIKMQRLCDWAKKAREELGNHYFVVDTWEGISEDFNNEDVIALCEEYDEIVGTKG